MSQVTGSGLLLVTMDPPEGFEQTLNKWYDDEHLAERLAMPGFLAAHRYRTVHGPIRYLALYDLASPEAVATPEYLGSKVNPTRLTRLVESRVSMRRDVYVQIDHRRASGEM